MQISYQQEIHGPWRSPGCIATLGLLQLDIGSLYIIDVD